jgi:asparagine synthase (glutamine-hydrolysing)
MCGIAGFVDSPVAVPLMADDATARVRQMCDVIRHRGPDDEGFRIEPGVALGMRRLSIIDVAGGHQPIANEDGTVWIVFNGEVYNFRELRAELEAQGHRFSTSTDTEAIVHAYEQWGTDAIRRLRGMFGLAIWDSRTRTLLLARDRVGIKPLYYSVAGGRLRFGSELKSLLCDPDLPVEIDVDALDHYLSFLYTAAGHVDLPRRLQAGAWTPAYLAGRTSPCPAVLAAGLWRAVQRHGTGGGRRTGARPGRCGFVAHDQRRPDWGVSLRRRRLLGRRGPHGAALERPGEDVFNRIRRARVRRTEHARRVAEYYGTDHHEFVVRPDGLRILDDLIAHFDEPFADSSAIPTWYVSEIARRHVTVVLSGDGGDELFGGYDRYLPHPRVVAFDRYAPQGLRRVAAIAGDRLPHGVRGKNFLRHVGRSERGRYLDAIRFFSSDEKPSLLSADVRSALGALDPEIRLARHFERYASLPWASQMMRFDLETYLPDDVLTKVDRMSMAHSIESRVPLLDNEVVDLANALPASLKIRNGRRKHVLKEVAARLLPDGIVDRKKQGFGVPLGTWFRGDLKELFADTLLAPEALQRGYFEPRFVRRIVNEHLSGRRDHTLRLWQLVVFERWHRQYVGSRLGTRPARAASLG